MIIGKFRNYGLSFAHGVVTTLGAVLVEEGYRNYRACVPDKGIKALMDKKKRKKKFDDIMSQTNLKNEMA